MRAVIYARFSSHNQREESIEGQVRECKAFAEKANMSVVDVYSDAAISGTTDKRPAFQKMMSDSDKKLFDAVIVYTLDRFARNRYDSAMYKYRLKKNGVKIFYAKQSIPDTPEGIMLESILEGYAEYYSENLSRNVKRGLKENFLKGISIGSAGVCFGYDLSPDRKYVINPTEASYVKKMFNWYLEGDSAQAIANKLNNLGVKTKRGKNFRRNSVIWILSNKQYIGRFYFGGMTSDDFKESIIDDITFEKVQNRLNNPYNGNRKGKALVDYVLTGKLFCGICGERMIGTCSKAQGIRHHYYVCHNKKIKKCEKKREPKDNVEGMVFDAIDRYVLTEENISRIAKEVSKLAKEPDDDITWLEKEHEDILSRKNNLLKAIEEGIITESTKERLKELETEQAVIESKIETEKIKKPPLREQDIKTFLSSVKSGNLSERKRIINTLIDKVYVYENNPEKKVVIYLNTHEHNTITLDNAYTVQSRCLDCTVYTLTRNHIILTVR